MSRIFTHEERPFADIEFAAIAMVKTDDPTQRHIGILHRENGVLKLIHLAWNYKLKNESPQDSRLWIDIEVAGRRLRQVAAICRKVWRSNQNRLPYAFSNPIDCFDPNTGKFLLGPTRHGLTCASFVLAVFHVAGLPLAKYETWPVDRVEDVVWQQKIVGYLSHPKSGATPEHIAAVTNEIGCVRFRPEEVAGAATVIPRPVDFESAKDRAQIILERLSPPPA